MSYRELLCRHLGITDEQIMSMVEYEDHVACVINYGVAGGKKFLVPYDDLPASDNIDATSAARQLSIDNEIALILVRGTGKDGRITKADVERFMEQGPEYKERTCQEE